jgi:hypothetical protein
MDEKPVTRAVDIKRDLDAFAGVAGLCTNLSRFGDGCRLFIAVWSNSREIWIRDTYPQRHASWRRPLSTLTDTPSKPAG